MWGSVRQKVHKDWRARSADWTRIRRCESLEETHFRRRVSGIQRQRSPPPHPLVLGKGEILQENKCKTTSDETTRIVPSPYSSAFRKKYFLFSDSESENQDTTINLTTHHRKFCQASLRSNKTRFLFASFTTKHSCSVSAPRSSQVKTVRMFS